MSIIVQKYGGSSVADLDRIRLVAKKICATKAAGHQVVAVVSAMGKTTNELIALAKQLEPSPPRRELDMLLTTGERITSALLSIAIHAQGYQAVSLTGSQCGILTNDRHSNAKIIEIRPIRVQDELENDNIVIVAGFQGMSYKREITTLGRGGSDTTAVALAAALGAAQCEIYSDVDGVYTADPNRVDGAMHLPTISYEEMQEMAVAGAKVLQADAIEFAKRADIAIYARASFAPGRETIVRKGAPTETSGVRAVVTERGVALVSMIGRAAMERIEEILITLEESITPIKEFRLQYPEDNLAWARGSFVISTEVLPDWEKTKASLLRVGGEAMEITEGLAALSLIGVGINRDNKNLIQARRVVTALGAPILGLATSGFRISIVTKESYLDAALQALHATFIEHPNRSVPPIDQTSVE